MSLLPEEATIIDPATQNTSNNTMMSKTTSDDEQIEKINKGIAEAIELAETEPEDEEQPYSNKYKARDDLVSGIWRNILTWNRKQWQKN